ncbi:MAG: family 78 glycoside hydrolase catalytic domain [Ruminococcus sp.]|nr:family 78 glycoside hydrolase catalytic domain [Candidatus Copronaster equi]
MKYSKNFISATKEYSDYNTQVCAPYIRKTFELDFIPEKAEMLICGLGFYEFRLNGKRMTHGYLAPYISNPNDLLYYDRYDLTNELKKGKNTIAFMLGNGMQNSFDGAVWDFQLADWRSAPKLALTFEASNEDKKISFEADETFKVAPSPVYSDSLRTGECYDANKEIDGWDLPDFNDSQWSNALTAETPSGEPREGKHRLIKKVREIKPVSVTNGGIINGEVRSNLPLVELDETEGASEGYIYDFGENITGIPRLKIRGKKGQKIVIQCGEALWNGNNLDMTNIGNFQPLNMTQRDIYICKGDGEETWEPMFTFHGFQYCFVTGITPEQATDELLTYVVMHADLKPMGGFKCSNELVNKLQKAVVRSDLSNLFYFPTDCPHREKNGWTGDAQLSAEQFLINLDAEDTIKEWLFNIRKSQNEQGAIPGIIPTGGWGFEWGNGPAWDAVLIELPYRVWQYRGDREILEQNADSIFKYITYLTTRVDEKGLMHIGLGDWLPVDNKEPCPLEITDTLVSMDISRKASEIFTVLGQTQRAEFALNFSNRLKTSFRENLIDDNLEVYTKAQAPQAIALYYGAFNEDEKEKAFSHLLRYIEDANRNMTVGVIGSRTMFHVLSEFGYDDLALQMIAKPDYPSFASWITEFNANSMFEIITHDPPNGYSHNHHFFGDISAWFIKNLAGIKPNPNIDDENYVIISPAFVNSLDYAEGWYNLPCGKVSVKWHRNKNEIILEVEAPDNAKGKIQLRSSNIFADGTNESPLKSGQFIIK